MAAEDVQPDETVPRSAHGAWIRQDQTQITPMPTISDLARSLADLEHTLSEVLVLLYQVLQTNESLVEQLYRERIRPKPGR